jgi:protein O-GlcNAc transferase
MNPIKHNPMQQTQPPPAEMDALLALYNTRRFAELEIKARRLVDQFPTSAYIWELLGLSLQMQGKDSLHAFQRTAELLPNDAGAHYNLGSVQKTLGQLDEALASYGRALELKPDYADAHYNLGNALKELGQIDAAVSSYRQALEINPDFAEAYYNLGHALKDLGQFEGSVACYRQALELKPDYSDAWSALLFSLNYTNRTLEYCLEEAREYGRKVGQKASRFTDWRCSAQPERLRVGVVSGDLYNHPVGYFLESVLSQINQTRIELIAYPTHHKEDELTARIRPFFSAWKPLVGLSDEAAANLIHADGVHVLIDLSGHTGRNRLPVFAWKPAPVQVTWLGYFATTGVAEMDYILGDKWLLPDGEAHHFVEKGWRLSGSISCLTPPHEDIKVEKLPALQNQSITFGTLNNSSKMNGRVVACWARILNAIPNSRLYLNMRNLRDNALRKSVIERYAAHGVAENRLILEPTTGRIAAFNSYNRMDIALDPFPYPGGTTSYEALWMGVPVLTMRGDKYISHLGESIMHHAGLPDWIAADEEDYIAKAVAFASDLEHLAKLRAGLRQQVLASPLFDAPRFARNFEHALWGMWLAPSDGNSSPSPEHLTASPD